METIDWPATRLNWEPIGKNGMAVAVYDAFIWMTGKDGRTNCMTLETAREFYEWLGEELEGHAKQVATTTEDDARNRARSFTEGWQRTIQEGRQRVRRG